MSNRDVVIASNVIEVRNRDYKYYTHNCICSRNFFYQSNCNCTCNPKKKKGLEYDYLPIIDTKNFISLKYYFYKKKV